MWCRTKKGIEPTTSELAKQLHDLEQENSALELELDRFLEERSIQAVELGMHLAADRAHTVREICPFTAIHG